MRQILGIKLSQRAKFWLDSSEGDKFISVWFVVIGDVVAVIEEKWRRGEASNSNYEVKWWDVKELEELLSEYWSGAYRYKGYKLNRMDAVEKNWAKEELEEAKKWWKIRKKYAKAEELNPEELDFYRRGVKNGYYLVAPF
jgi:hypothetical protein